MKTDFSKLNADELDRLLTELDSGELDAGQAADLREFLRHQPDVAAAAERRAKTTALVREALSDSPTATADSPVRLSDDRREALLATFRASRVEPPRQTKPHGSRWYIPMSIAAVLIGLLVALVLIGDLDTLSKPREPEHFARITPLPSFGGRVSGTSDKPTLNEPLSADAYRMSKDKALGAQVEEADASKLAALGNVSRFRAALPNPNHPPANRGEREEEQIAQATAPASSASPEPQSQWQFRNFLADYGEVANPPAGASAGDALDRAQGARGYNNGSLEQLLEWRDQNGTITVGGLTAAGGGFGGSGAPKFGGNSALSVPVARPSAPAASQPPPPASPAPAPVQLATEDLGRDGTELALERKLGELPALQEKSAKQDALGVFNSDADGDKATFANGVSGPGSGGQLYAGTKMDDNSLALHGVDKSGKKQEPTVTLGFNDSAAVPADALNKRAESAKPESFFFKAEVESRGTADKYMKSLDDRESRDHVFRRKAAAAPQGQVANDPVPAAKPAVPAPVPQPEILTRENAFSTFSMNVSDVSFRLAGASLEKGAMPEAAGIRSEEFLNAFDYRDPLPAGAPIAFTAEQARYPFAHNRDALRLSVKTAAEGRQAGRPLNIIVLLDNSGSMERADRVRITEECFRTLARQMQPQDKLSVVTFARTARLWIDGVSGSQASAVASQVGTLTPEGGTNLEDALDLAYRTARRHFQAQAVNRVVLLTDGAANLGNTDPQSLKDKVETHRKQGIAFDCFGVGWEGYNDDLLETLSRNGDGRYGFVNTPEQASTEFAAQLAGALKVAASDVKVQVEFNPKRTTAYRQVGYAKHQLTKEQFRDNSVDAAEIGAAEAGNALYIIETNPNGEGPVATVRVRYKVPGTSDYKEMEWAVPYTPGAPAAEQSSPAMKLALSASAFSEWLAGSPFAAEVSSDKLLNILNGVPATFGADPRPGRLEWMIRQAKSISGR